MFTQIVIVCSLFFVNVIAQSGTEGLGSQVIGGVEKLKEMANTCLEDSRRHAENDTFGEEFKQCIKSKVFHCLDQVLDAATIDIGNGVEFVKDENSTSLTSDSGRKATEPMSWQSLLMDRAEKVFQTHVVRINLAKSRKLFSDGARGKHGIKLLFPLMVVIFMKMSALMVPLGFQFMAMIGGKALLLSKMALLMASVQGLKGYAHGWPSYGGHQQSHHTGSAPHTDHHFSSGYGKSSS